VESALAWTLIGIIGITFALLFSFGLETSTKILSRKETLANARYATNRILQELIALKGSDLLSIAPARIDFVDRFGRATDFHTEVSGALFDLYRGPDLLAKNIKNLSFSFFDAGGSAISDFSQISEVRRIQLDLAVKDTNALGDVSVRGEVYPRNFYYNNFQ